MIPIIGSVAVVGSIGLLVVALASSSTPEQSGSLFRQAELERSTRERVISPLLSSFAGQARHITPKAMVSELERLLVLSGARDRWPLELVLAAKLLFAAVVGGLALLVAWSSPTAFSVMGGTLATVAAFNLPNIILGRMVKARKLAVSRSLPEVLDQLTVLAEAGLGFDSALHKVVEASEGPLIDEFKHANRLVRMGVPRQTAVGDIAERVDVPEVRQFISAIRQADSLGVPLAQVLRIQSTQVRELQRLAAEERAMRLPVKLTFPLVFCVLPALFVLLLGPVAMRLMENGLA